MLEKPRKAKTQKVSDIGASHPAQRVRQKHLVLKTLTDFEILIYAGLQTTDESDIVELRKTIEACGVGGTTLLCQRKSVDQAISNIGLLNRCQGDGKKNRKVQAHWSA
ncbi:hypothetical protein ElyMa_003644300 [Elysia marginata]|uniref:Uncharacterized protein n=1 Tax=Elysia marginata TaxID=1093978 RepID=A0AAV4EWQ0_9GAST|nr:hypothetical protein ElyMa_003644300 [Elysia marginata]